jgi:hypothetical protein
VTVSIIGISSLRAYWMQPNLESIRRKNINFAQTKERSTPIGIDLANLNGYLSANSVMWYDI